MDARSLVAGAAVGLIAACAGETNERGSAGSGLGSIGDSASTGGGEDAESGPSGGSGPGGSGAHFDVGNNESGDPPQEDGCQRVDFLFVIDNSASMQDEQAALVGAFPGFMNAIQNTLSAGSDYHILVADTDAWGRCSPADCSHATCQDPVAGNYACQGGVFDACDQARGAGVVHPAGQFATNAPCSFVGGNRYIVEGEPDLGLAFECAATVGVAGHQSERPMDAIVAAVDPTINAVGGCNEGFLRDDAILVVTFISDDPWFEDSGMPADWHDAVVAAKNGDPSSVVVLGLTPAWPGCRDGSGPPKGDHWAEFVSLWGAGGLHGNVCSTAAEYVAFFEQAVGTIDDVCDNFQPPG